MQQKIREAFPVLQTGKRSFVVKLHKGDITNNGATPWFTKVYLGSNNQPLKLMIDTGTTHTWVTSQWCKTTACNAHSKFNCRESESFKPIGDHTNPVNIDFGPWGQLLGYLGRDTLRCAGLILHRLRFYLATYYAGEQFEELVCDGGISIPSVTPPETAGNFNSDNNSFSDSSEILNLLSIEQEIQRVVTFAFGCGKKENEGMCAFGECQVQREANELSLINTGTYCTLWTVCLDSIRYGRDEMLCNINFILDTGSSRFKGDPKLISAIVDKVCLAGKLPQVLTDQSQLQEYDVITLVLNGCNYRLFPEQYFLKIRVGENEWEWHLAFHPMSGMEGYLLVGSVFLDSVISRFDYDKRKVTLYKRR